MQNLLMMYQKKIQKQNKPPFERKKNPRKYYEINEKYQSLLEEARFQSDNKLIFFTYGGPFSISANLANRIKYEFPDKYVVIGFKKESFVNISLRGINIKTITLEAIKDIPNATGGGHEMATGARMAEEYIPQFKEKLQKLIDSQQSLAI